MRLDHLQPSFPKWRSSFVMHEKLLASASRSWPQTNGHSPFAFSWLAAVGERTQRVLLGTSVLTPTFRYQPAVVAQAFGTLGCLNPGRMILGVGAGESLNEVAVTAIAWPSPKERLARLR